jgi:hypothetical protein
MTLNDLVFLLEAHVTIDDDLLERARHYENTHRDLGACHGCCALTGTQHQPSCPRASILHDPEWRKRIQPQREAIVKRLDGTQVSFIFESQEEALEYLCCNLKPGEDMEIRNYTPPPGTA